MLGSAGAEKWNGSMVCHARQRRVNLVAFTSSETRLARKLGRASVSREEKRKNVQRAAVLEEDKQCLVTTR